MRAYGCPQGAQLHPTPPSPLREAQPGMSWQQSVRLGLRTMMGRAYPRLISAIREPEWLFYEVGLPLLRIIAFVLVYRTLKAPAQYTGFVILGGAMMAFWLNVLWMMAAQLHWERLSGNLELYLMAPASTLWILAGMAVGGMIATLFRAVVDRKSTRLNSSHANISY